MKSIITLLLVLLFASCGKQEVYEFRQERSDAYWKYYNVDENGTDVEFISSQNEIYPYYYLIDCFVLPSRFEPFGLVILESMFFNKDIILSKVPIAKFLPQNLSFNVGDLNQLKKLMLESFKRKSTPKYDLTKFDRNTQINKILNFYKMVLENYNKSKVL